MKTILLTACFVLCVTSAYGQAVPLDDVTVQLTANGGDLRNPHLHVQWNQNAQGVNQSQVSFINFTTSMFPSGLTAPQIQKATLLLFVEKGGQPGNITVCELASAWSSSNMTGNAFPPCKGGISPVSFTVTASQLMNGSFITVDVTSIVQDWYSSGGNYGIALLAEPPLTGMGNGINAQFDSMKDNGTGYPSSLQLVLQSQGPQGIPGPMGSPGATGATGAAGTNGTNGATGATGPEGPIGLTGATGPQGSAGPKGDTGPTGPQGATGATGATGTTGATGPQGTIGLTGATGGTGPQGPIGLTGATGAAGAAGTNGTNGATGANGATGPVGPAGAMGLPGTNGATGPEGPIGLTGATGAQGQAGTNGTNGTDGTNGTGFNFKGPFAATTQYSENDVVTYGGSSYLAMEPIQESTNGDGKATPETDMVNWSVMAAAGAPGATLHKWGQRISLLQTFVLLRHRVAGKAMNIATAFDANSDHGFGCRACRPQNGNCG